MYAKVFDCVDKPRSPALQADALPSESPGNPKTIQSIAKENMAAANFPRSI